LCVVSVVSLACAWVVLLVCFFVGKWFGLLVLKCFFVCAFSRISWFLLFLLLLLLSLLSLGSVIFCFASLNVRCFWLFCDNSRGVQRGWVGEESEGVSPFAVLAFLLGSWQLSRLLFW
jgi:hypothetical protein